MVAYSQLAESGRTLYACAARHWFAADALLDKVHNHASTLQRYAEQLACGARPHADRLAAPPGARRPDR